MKFELTSPPSNLSSDEEPQEHDDVQITDSGIDDAAGPVWVSKEATYRISRLRAANKSVVFARPDENLSQVTLKLMAGGFSQLPVMTSERDVKGVVSWHTIGSRLALGQTGGTALQMSESSVEINSSRSIFDAIPIVMANDYVLVRDEYNKISGIITAADLSLQFRDLTEPFLLLSEIENLLRNFIADHFSPAELAAACDSSGGQPTNITTIADLSFGEYIRLLQQPDRWERLRLAVDRAMFCERLDQIREIRNDVMHFDPDGIGEDEIIRLREFTRFLQQLTQITQRS